MEGKKAKFLNMNVSAIFPSRILFLRFLEVFVLFYGNDSRGKGLKLMFSNLQQERSQTIIFYFN